jgi:hypothetical protein
MSSTPAERSLAGRIASETSWANTKNRSAHTAPARAALDKKFTDAADGDPVRAEHLRKAHYLTLALKAARARRPVSTSPTPPLPTPSLTRWAVAPMPQPAQRKRPLPDDGSGPGLSTGEGFKSALSLSPATDRRALH